MQPYRPPEDPSLHRLAVTADLDNIDKHRFLHPVGTSVIEASISLTDPAGTALFHQFLQGTFRRDDPVTLFPFASDQSPVEVGGRLTPLIALDDFAPSPGSRSPACSPT